jgi:Ca2+-binding RTX toxin-like protein
MRIKIKIYSLVGIFFVLCLTTYYQYSYKPHVLAEKIPNSLNTVSSDSVKTTSVLAGDENQSQQGKSNDTHKIKSKNVVNRSEVLVPFASEPVKPPKEPVIGNGLPNEVLGDDFNSVDCSFNSFAGEPQKLCQGTLGNDIMTGNEDDNFILGYSGNDKMYGRSGQDVLKGGEGKDSIDGGAGHDDIIGDDYPVTGRGDSDYIVGDGAYAYGNDFIYAGEGNDYVNGGNGNDEIYGNDDDDTIIGEFGQDNLHGGSGEDKMDGGLGDDSMYGGSEDDKMDGGLGDDNLQGDQGADNIKGGDGKDKIYHDSLPPRYGVHPDGSKDTIDCGAEQDEVWINVRIDRDTAINCEIVHSDITEGIFDPGLKDTLPSK